MFDRNAYMKKYYSEQYQRRKNANKCTACGVSLPLGHPVLYCEVCKKRQAENSRKYNEKKKRELIRATIGKAQEIHPKKAFAGDAEKEGGQR